MAVKFLSEEWVAAVNDALAAHEGFLNAAAGVDLGFQFSVSDVPDSDDVSYFLDIKDGGATAGLGELEGADVTISSDYDTATSVSKGELNTQTAFMTGKLKVAGNLAKLMMHQNAIQQWGLATDTVDIEY